MFPHVAPFCWHYKRTANVCWPGHWILKTINTFLLKLQTSWKPHRAKALRRHGSLHTWKSQWRNLLPAWSWSNPVVFYFALELEEDSEALTSVLQQGRVSSCSMDQTETHMAFPQSWSMWWNFGLTDLISQGQQVVLHDIMLHQAVQTTQSRFQRPWS